jgi:tetraacyldisaccharide 4'-kinase
VPRVVAVGNLEVGGSGKTPLAVWLVERAARAGRRTAYVSRGFASVAAHGPLVTIVPGDGVPESFAGLRILSRDQPDLAGAVGDEGALVAHFLPEVPLAFARDKRRAVEAVARLGAEIVAVDDAFQSFALPRHVDVLLLDARHPLGNGRVLPAGRLREAPSGIARADVVVFNGARDEAAVADARTRVARWLRPGQRVYGLRREVDLVRVTPGASTSPAGSLLVAGIARPEDFRSSVEATGVRVVAAMTFRDHHAYTHADVQAVRARAAGGEIVTTDKDWVKLSRFDWGEATVWVARLTVELVGADDVDAWLLG